MTPNTTLPVRVAPSAPSAIGRAVTLASIAVAALAAALWGVIAMQGAPPGWTPPPQGGGYQSPPQGPGAPPPQWPPQNPYGPQPSSPTPPPQPPSRGTELCSAADCELCGSCMCDACVVDSVCEALSLCDVLSACQASARLGQVALASTPLLLPFVVLALWHRRERRREQAA
jgi:hypothetical protein